MEDGDIYKTKDFYLACSLRALGQPILDIQISRGIATFIFQSNGEDCHQLVKKYWDRKLIVKARDFVESINELKSRIHSS